MGRKAHQITKRTATRRASLAVLVPMDGDDPPSEIRLFVAGWNESEKGRFLFDEAAATATMAAYEAHGIDRMFDLEHLSLEDPETSANYDPDARAWCKLELRDGELWAVGITWTDDGAERLRSKKQRYVSPAFLYDSDRRVTKLFNVAITALPATHGTPALVAARAPTRDLRKLSTGPSLDTVRTAIAAALRDMHPESPGIYCDGPWVVDLFDASAVYEYDGHLYEVPYTFDGTGAKLGAPVEVQRSYAPISAPAPVIPVPASTATIRANSRHPHRTARLTGAPMPAAKLALSLDQIQKVAKALGLPPEATLDELLVAVGAKEAPAETPDPEPLADPPAPEPPKEDEEKQAEVMAATARLSRLTGKPTIGESVREVEIWRASHLELESGRAKLKTERETLELGQRKANAAKLVQLGAETPHTSGLAGGKLCQRLIDEPLVEQDARVAALLAARGGKLPEAPKPPAGGGTNAAGAKEFATPDGTVTLSARELAMCAEKNLDPNTYATSKAAREKS